jgi:hypothetical protein
MGAQERTRLEGQMKRSRGTWGSIVARGQTIEVDGSHSTSERDGLYLEHGWTERKRQSLDRARGQWIEHYMELVTREARDYLESDTTAVRRVDGGQTENGRVAGGKVLRHEEGLNSNMALNVVEEGLIEERFLMEKLLVYEVEAWEERVRNLVEEFMGRSDVPESGKERLTREWRGNCWKRLDTNIRAMDARMERAKAEISALPSNKLQSTLNSNLNYVHNEIRRAWRSVIERLVYTPTLSASSTPGSRFSQDLQKLAHRIDRFSAQPDQERRWHQEMACRLKKELADVEFRIGPL